MRSKFSALTWDLDEEEKSLLKIHNHKAALTWVSSLICILSTVCRNPKVRSHDKKLVLGKTKTSLEEHIFNPDDR